MLETYFSAPKTLRRLRGHAHVVLSPVEGLADSLDLRDPTRRFWANPEHVVISERLPGHEGDAV